MRTNKKEAIDLIETMPDDSSILDIVETLLLKEQVQKGLDDVEAGRVISHEELKKQIQQWRSSNGR